MINGWNYYRNKYYHSTFKILVLTRFDRLDAIEPAFWIIEQNHDNEDGYELYLIIIVCQVITYI